MSKNILVLMASPRKYGNTSALCDAFIEGALENGNKVTKICASDAAINPCKHCQYCESHDGECIQKDGMQKVYPAFKDADVIVLASPLYFYTINGQLKTIIDRLYAEGSSKSFDYDEKESVFLMTCMERDEAVFDQAKMFYKTLLAKALPWKSRGEIYVSGLTEEKDSIKGHHALEKARELGRKI